MSEPVGFTQASAEMGGIRETNDWMQQQISEGHLRINPEAAEAGAKAHEGAADKVAVLIRKTEQLQRVDGLGDYASGRQLAEKFGLKAKNGEQTGAADLLAQCRDELNRKADLYRQAAKDYRSTDDQIAQDLQRGMEQ